MSTGWSIYVDLLIVVNMLGCAWLLWVNRRAPTGKVGKGEPLENTHDGIQELNNPLPAWWTWLFIGTLVFGVAYFVLFPGMGAFAGVLGWSSQGQYEDEVDAADAVYGPILQAFATRPIPELAGDPEALEIGGRLFRTRCATCHGSDARGFKGYPNLTDGDWLWGGEPETIVATITAGRVGNMPALGAALSDEQVSDLAQHVISLSGRDHEAEQAEKGAAVFATLCVACHGAEGKGNPAMGAPNLTDDIWLHGGRVSEIEYQIRNGRINQMPAHADILSPEKIHILAAYVFSLSRS